VVTGANGGWHYSFVKWFVQNVEGGGLSGTLSQKTDLSFGGKLNSGRLKKRLDFKKKGSNPRSQRRGGLV